MKDFPNLVINQTWSRRYSSSRDDLLMMKMEIARFAREMGHVPVAYRVTPATVDYSRGDFYGEVIVYCINPKNQVWQKND